MGQGSLLCGKHMNVQRTLIHGVGNTLKKHILSVNDCILVLLMFYTASQLFWYQGCEKKKTTFGDHSMTAFVWRLRLKMSVKPAHCKQKQKQKQNNKKNMQIYAFNHSHESQAGSFAGSFVCICITWTGLTAESISFVCPKQPEYSKLAASGSEQDQV